MNIKQLAKIQSGQDGVIWKNQLFRFKSKGQCFVYDLQDVDPNCVKELEPIGTFVLDQADRIAPHSNAVCFGIEYYDINDEYPLLYSNIYNNFKNFEDKMIGVCCVYRLQREENTFKTTLVQLIEIGFTNDATLWKAQPDAYGVRPYGNFLIDSKNKYYYGFVMRDENLGTRYFKFKIPTLTDGEMDTVYGVKRVKLTQEDIIDQFDCPFHRFIQGGIIHDDYLYSTEGFSDSPINPPAIRIIDLVSKKQKEYINIIEKGYNIEPEMIDFYGEDCYYSDVDGNLYCIEFDD